MKDIPRVRFMQFSTMSDGYMYLQYNPFTQFHSTTWIMFFS